jgi:hypothetical protein
MESIDWFTVCCRVVVLAVAAVAVAEDSTDAVVMAAAS